MLFPIWPSKIQKQSNIGIKKLKSLSNDWMALAIDRYIYVELVVHCLYLELIDVKTFFEGSKMKGFKV